MAAPYGQDNLSPQSSTTKCRYSAEAYKMLDGYPLEITLTAANSAAQAWYGYDQGIVAGLLVSEHFLNVSGLVLGRIILF